MLVAVVAIIAFIGWRRTIADTVDPYIYGTFYLLIRSNSSISLQLHLEGSNETPEENRDKAGQDDFFASEEQFPTSSILEEPAAALVKPKSPRDPVKNGDDGPAPDVSMAVSGEVRRCFLKAVGKSGAIVWYIQGDLFHWYSPKKFKIKLEYQDWYPLEVFLKSFSYQLTLLGGVTSSPVRYIDIEYRLSIYRHF